MKDALRSLLPDAVLCELRRFRQSLADRRNARRTPREIFTEIYEKGKWSAGERGFCSGAGSSTESVTRPYVQMITEYLQAAGRGKTVVDLGCGDLEIGKQLIPWCSRYIGVDVVPSLIEKHASAGWGQHVRFLCLDIVDDALPDGDICLLRQVLQHLSNRQIAAVLPKLRKYQVTFITEHYPGNDVEAIPNKDIVHGSKVRAEEGSGVYFDKPPFNVPPHCMEMVLEVPGVGLASGKDQGVIRTYKLEP